MCLIAWNWQPESAQPLVLLSNRDEFYQRPTLPLHWWNTAANGSRVLAGKDLQAGGTWLGVTSTGRLAALTNYRTTEPQRVDAPSRGALVSDFLQGTLTAADYLQILTAQSQDYNPFNLLVFDGLVLLGLESREAKVIKMVPGIGAVSNADFQTPWPKLQRLTTGLRTASSLMPLLHDRALAPDHDLPATGVALELERALSAIFIATPDYGTRACSVVKIRKNTAEFTEESWGPEGLLGTVTELFNW